MTSLRRPRGRARLRSGTVVSHPLVDPDYLDSLTPNLICPLCRGLLYVAMTRFGPAFHCDCPKPRVPPRRGE